VLTPGGIFGVCLFCSALKMNRFPPPLTPHARGRESGRFYPGIPRLAALLHKGEGLEQAGTKGSDSTRSRIIFRRTQWRLYRCEPVLETSSWT